MGGARSSRATLPFDSGPIRGGGAGRAALRVRGPPWTSDAGRARRRTGRATRVHWARTLLGPARPQWTCSLSALAPRPHPPATARRQCTAPRPRRRRRQRQRLGSARREWSPRARQRWRRKRDRRAGAGPAPGVVSARQSERGRRVRPGPRYPRRRPASGVDPGRGRAAGVARDEDDVDDDEQRRGPRCVRVRRGKGLDTSTHRAGLRPRRAPRAPLAGRTPRPSRAPRGPQRFSGGKARPQAGQGLPFNGRTTGAQGGPGHASAPRAPVCASTARTSGRRPVNTDSDSAPTETRLASGAGNPSRGRERAGPQALSTSVLEVKRNKGDAQT